MWKNKFKKEREEIETMENLNRVLLENVLPAHVAEHFLARSLKNEVRGAGWVWAGSQWAWRLKVSGGCYHTVALYTVCPELASYFPFQEGIDYS